MSNPMRDLATIIKNLEQGSANSGNPSAGGRPPLGLPAQFTHGATWAGQLIADEIGKAEK